MWATHPALSIYNLKPHHQPGSISKYTSFHILKLSNGIPLTSHIFTITKRNILFYASIVGTVSPMQSLLPSMHTRGRYHQLYEMTQRHIFSLYYIPLPLFLQDNFYAAIIPSKWKRWFVQRYVPIIQRLSWICKTNCEWSTRKSLKYLFSLWRKFGNGYWQLLGTYILSSNEQYQ